MIKILEFAGHTHDKPELFVELEYDTRKRSRINAQAISGEQLGIVLPRGSVLNDRDLLKSECGKLVEVLAAQEELSSVCSDDDFLLLKAAYHLGNRHMPLQLLNIDGVNCIRYQKDYVLDDMVEGFGLKVQHIKAGFQPENGAYGKHGGHHHH